MKTAAIKKTRTRSGWAKLTPVCFTLHPTMVEALDRLGARERLGRSALARRALATMLELPGGDEEARAT
jgi:hypothetical protein